MTETILSIFIVLLIIANFFMFNLGKKQGEKAFFDALFAFGYESKVNDFKKLNELVTPGGIVFVGDSITQDYNIHEYYPNVHCYNRGIGGDTSVGLLKRLKESVFDLNPTKVVLLIGTNDLELLDITEEQIYLNIKEAVEKIKVFDQKIEVILLSVYPTNDTMDKKTVGKRSIERIKMLNERLETIQNVTYVNVFDLLVDDSMKLNKKYSPEGLHLNQAGYLIVTKKISLYL